ncbi:hypothetical protein OS493_040026, partial [Desmophyllum pertusum]
MMQNGLKEGNERKFPPFSAQDLASEVGIGLARESDVAKIRHDPWSTHERGTIDGLRKV